MKVHYVLQGKILNTHKIKNKLSFLIKIIIYSEKLHINFLQTLGSYEYQESRSKLYWHLGYVYAKSDCLFSDSQPNYSIQYLHSPISYVKYTLKQRQMFITLLVLLRLWRAQCTVLSSSSTIPIMWLLFFLCTKWFHILTTKSILVSVCFSHSIFGK